MPAETQSGKYEEEKMRYRVSIDIPGMEWDVDVESREDAIKEAITYLKDTMRHVFLDNLGLDLEEIITVEAIHDTEQDREKQED